MTGVATRRVGPAYAPGDAVPLDALTRRQRQQVRAVAREQRSALHAAERRASAKTPADEVSAAYDEWRVRVARLARTDPAAADRARAQMTAMLDAHPGVGGRGSTEVRQ